MNSCPAVVLLPHGFPTDTAAWLPRVAFTGGPFPGTTSICVRELDADCPLLVTLEVVVKLLGESDSRQVGPYQVVAELGRGGMGRVLLGAGSDGRLVAVKVVRAAFAEDEQFRERFRREVAASRQVSGAYTAAVVDADPDASTPWLASTFVPGPSLAEAIEADVVLPEDAVLRLAAGLARALIEVHRTGLVHRDLKPSNVLLTDDGPRVIDFGIARAADNPGGSSVTHTGTLVGSPGFMAPEQAEGRAATAASDVFALGAVLFVACTGRDPFAGPAVPQILYNVVHQDPDLSAIPEGPRRLIEKCLVKDPATRPSPAELLELIGALTPSARPWPAAVHQQIAAQRTEVEELLERVTQAPIAATVTTVAANSQSAGIEALPTLTPVAPAPSPPPPPVEPLPEALAILDGVSDAPTMDAYRPADRVPAAPSVRPRPKRLQSRGVIAVCTAALAAIAVVLAVALNDGASIPHHSLTTGQSAAASATGTGNIAPTVTASGNSQQPPCVRTSTGVCDATQIPGCRWRKEIATETSGATVPPPSGAVPLPSLLQQAIEHNRADQIYATDPQLKADLRTEEADLESVLSEFQASGRRTNMFHDKITRVAVGDTPNVVMDCSRLAGSH